MTTDEERFNRLPKWARDHIKSLERRTLQAERETARLEEALAGDGGSPFHVESVEKGLALPSGVRYLVYKDGDFELRLHGDGHDLEVMCNSWHGVSVVPQASNVVHIRPGRVK